MGEIQTDVNTIEFDYQCDTCKTGIMAYTGWNTMDNPPKNIHICDHCGERMDSFKKYPRIIGGF